MRPRRDGARRVTRFAAYPVDRPTDRPTNRIEPRSLTCVGGSYEDGTALAVETMCDVFHVKRHTEFLPVYLASYYDSLAEALQVEFYWMTRSLGRNAEA